jgi:gamma-glutamyl:cysteine ligase YbdK (ATP-grasp superfamily)
MTCSCILRNGEVVTLCDVHEAALKTLVVDNAAQIQKVRARLAPPFDWNRFQAATVSKDGCILYDAHSRRIARVRSLHPSYKQHILVSVGLYADILLTELGAPKP